MLLFGEHSASFRQYGTRKLLIFHEEHSYTKQPGIYQETYRTDREFYLMYEMEGVFLLKSGSKTKAKETNLWTQIKKHTATSGRDDKVQRGPM